ncbi:MAG: S8 family serine peptidase [Planctomycetes bacterium]|nr:S8 family serine peptidase [Planctomycetota bacterium]
MQRTVTSLVLLSTLCAAALAQDNDESRLMLHYRAFDPTFGEPDVPSAFAAGAGNRLFLVQYASIPTQADRDALHAQAAEVTWYAPHNGYVIRVDGNRREGIAGLPNVRWIGAFHPAYKFDTELLARLLNGAVAKDRYILVMIDPKQDEKTLVAAVERSGGSMWRYAGGNLLIEADLTGAQLGELAHENTVLWIQRATAPEVDMDNARIQGGANYIEGVAGYTGKGMRGHIMEGIYPSHPEFQANAYRTAPLQVFSGVSTTHGNSTFGEIFSRGALPAARGMCPDGQGYFTDYNYIFNTAAMSTAQNSRYGVVAEITDPTKQWKVMFQTASWGYPQGTAYEARAAEMDWIIHQFDIPICQSQSNTGNQNSRPQAWAKNIISVGALVHLGTANPNDDGQSGTSMGPASDLRIKPDLCAYYDAIHTTNGATTYTTSFGGTSGATPMVAGHLGLTLEMFTDGLFGQAATPNWQSRFGYKPHFSTAKALMINTARQYDPAINGAGATSRFRQGWGFPSLQDLYDLRNKMLALDEVDVLQQGGARAYYVYVKPATPQFRATMVYADLAAAAPFSSPHRVNNLNLRVVSPTGVVYHGNNGMATTPINRFTPPGGAPNNLDTVENVFVQNPLVGVWTVEVSAPLVAMDQHLETPAVDADFALVASGIGAGRDNTGPTLDLVSTPGTLSVSLTGAPTTYAEGFVFYSLTATRPRAMGNWLGVEADAVTLLSFSAPAMVGDALHFLPTAAPGTFPNAPHSFPAPLAQVLQGYTIDAVALWLDGSGAPIAASNVDRVTVQ